jgi:D-serine deaminase-like pyridoxal phosphate-dependent protein
MPAPDDDVSARLGPNEALIGVPGSRNHLDTPALCLEVDAMDRNIAAMAVYCRDKRVALRPHAKTHKSVRIAQRQITAGAIGICCATIGEAEVMARGGIAALLVTSPQVTAPKLARLAALNVRVAGGVAVVADHPDNVAALAQAARAAGKTLDVVVDFSAGHHRTGTATPDDALALATAIADADGLRLAGLQAYYGNLQHVAGRRERQDGALRQHAVIAALVGKLRAAGLAVPLVTGAGTGTHDIDADAGVFTELQAGSYVFMDVEYADALSEGRDGLPFETAPFVQTAVVSVASATVPGGYVTTDAGLKCFATEGPRPRLMTAAVTTPAVMPDARPGDAAAPDNFTYAYAGDEHGRLSLPPGAPVPALGSRIEVVTPHCDPTVNLHDCYHLVRGDTLVDIWPVDARGKR